MNDFRSFTRSRRVPANAMEPVIDPAGWTAQSLGGVDDFSYVITDRDADELVAGIAAFRRHGVPVEDVGRDNFPLTRLSREDVAITYLGLGSYLGKTMSQNKHGHILGHVKDLGGDYADTNTRGYMTHAEMRFHSDACDYVGLLCLAAAKRGGESRVASSITVYNRMLDERPDLAKELCNDIYRSRSGEANPGEAPWIKHPIFCFADGTFSALGLGAAVDKAQKLPGVPPFTPAQKEAIARYRTTVEACAVDMDLRPGDIQFLNNFVTLHTRREYEDWPEPERKRHLLRLWLSDPSSRPLPKDLREGRQGRGVLLEGVKLIAPLDVD